MEKIPTRILLVEDDFNISNIVKFQLQKKGFDVQCVFAGDEAIKVVQEGEFDVVLLDVSMPGRSGVEVLQEIKKLSALTQVIMVTANTLIDTAVQALRLGALDYITKPINFDDLEQAITDAMERIQTLRQELAIQRLVQSRAAFPTLVAESEAMGQAMQTVEGVADSNAPVLILGESGTGKELVARTIHLKSFRNRASFMSISCANSPELVLESEIFGQEIESLPGTSEIRRGVVEVAHRGTLFVDEIGDMSMSLQAGLLRVMETGEYRRVGGRGNLYSDIRVIAATNKDLGLLVNEKRFNGNLLDRLNSTIITLPALRDRKEDIWPLAQYFLSVLCRETGKKKVFVDDVRIAFERYHWPANVRELRNVVERLILVSNGEFVSASDLPFELAYCDLLVQKRSDSSALEEAMKRHIARTIAKAKGDSN